MMFFAEDSPIRFYGLPMISHDPVKVPSFGLLGTVFASKSAFFTQPTSLVFLSGGFHFDVIVTTDKPLNRRDSIIISDDSGIGKFHTERIGVCGCPVY